MADMPSASAESSIQDKANGDNKRKRKVHTRSRTGCLSCRQRHKRCDEEYEDGSCQRCRKSGLACKAAPPRKPKDRQNTASGSSPSDTEESNTGKNASMTASSSQMVNNNVLPNLPNPHDTISTISNTTFRSLFPALPASSSTNPFSVFSHDTLGTGLDVVFPFQPNTDAPVSSEQISTFLESLCEGGSSEPLYHDLPQFGEASNSIAAVDPFNIFDINHTSPPYDFGQSTLTGTTFHPPLPHDPGSAMSFSALFQLGDSSTQIARSPSNAPGSGDPHLDRLNRLAAIDKAAVEDRSGNLPGSTPADVNVGEKDFSPKWDDAEKYKNPFRWNRVALDYKAYQESWIYRPEGRRINQSWASTNPLHVTAKAAVLEALRLRADQFTADQSTSTLPTGENLGSVYSGFALALLGNPSSLSLHESLAGIHDLQTYNFMVAGGAASYGVLRIGETIVRMFMGDSPELDLADAIRLQQHSLIVYSQADIGRCLCTYDATPFFRLRDRPVEDIGEAFSALLEDMPYCVPLPVQQILAKIAIISPNAACAQPQELELAIRNIDTTDPLLRKWRLCATILFLQRRSVAALHPVIRDAAMEMLLEFPPVPCQKYETFPLFIAGTVATTQTQRQAVNRRWVSAPERGFEEAWLFLKMLWEEMDKRGAPIDWIHLARDKEISLAFF